MWWLYALLSAFFAALTAIFAKMGVAQISSDLATAVRTAVVLILAWGIVLAKGQLSGIRQLNGHTWLFLVLSGLATGASWLCYFRALQLGKVGQVAPVDKFSLVLTLVLSALLLGEALSWKMILGAALILIGTLVIIL